MSAAAAVGVHHKVHNNRTGSEAEEAKALDFETYVHELTNRPFAKREAVMDARNTNVKRWDLPSQFSAHNSRAPTSLVLKNRLQAMSLGKLVTGFIVIRVCMCFVFAALFSTLEDGCCGSDDYWDNFDFVFQTTSTIGYGTLSPVGREANFLVFISSLLALMADMLFGGLVFMRFMMPAYHIEFSEFATWCNNGRNSDSTPQLRFRIANHNGKECVLGNLLIRANYKYRDGDTFRTKEVRLSNPHRELLPDVMTVIHDIDSTSPLWGKTWEEMHDGENARIIIAVEALIMHTNIPIFFTHQYSIADLMVGYKFEDQFTHNDDELVCDLAKTNSYLPAPLWYPVVANDVASEGGVKETPGLM